MKAQALDEGAQILNVGKVEGRYLTKVLQSIRAAASGAHRG